MDIPRPNGQDQPQSLSRSVGAQLLGRQSLQFATTLSSSAIHGINHPLRPIPAGNWVFLTAPGRVTLGGNYQAELTGESQGGTYPPGRLTGPIQFIVRLLEFWRLDREDACSLLGYEVRDRNLVDDLLNGSTTLRGRDAKDRIAALFRIRSLLAGLFPDPDSENEWLRTPLKALNQRSPLEMLREGSMENLLTLRQLVEHGAGL